ncbi:MAG: SUF system Fe-S cluster assembly protein [Thiohalocapsa sp.]|jgi:FeS assembly SUF system protein|uniref:SUF system Fe-S cluster assembly protein n=1 Tax=Thiohalocapsa sp. TaxID=2497641 RepID=UPI0025F6FC0D|nr:SUF system Fe-S cluster assembly protein [Thiohalocapsa sp.]MCG6941731.1 SUF system Fe-S cluster assembly protein [Thiohalocapsa sp.]
MNRLARFAGFGAGHEEGVDRDDIDAEAAASDAAAPPGTGSDVDAAGGEALREPIIAALRQVHDPEIPVNIYDLGLIYRIDITGRGNVAIDMTLTAPACPVAGMMPVMVKDAVKRVEGVGEVIVELVWDPPWSPETMSDEAKLQLGML